MDQQSKECKTLMRGVAQQYDEQEGLRPIGYYIGLIIGGQAQEDEQEAGEAGHEYR